MSAPCQHGTWQQIAETDVSRVSLCTQCLMATQTIALPPKRLAASTSGYDDLDVAVYARGSTVLAKRIETATGDLDGASSFALAAGTDSEGPITMPREMFERLAFEAGYVIVGVVE